MAVILSADKERLDLVLDRFPQQIKDASVLNVPALHQKFSHIVLCGVGGSGLPSEIVKSVASNWLVTSVKNYTFPSYAADALVFAVSFSGNTEETLEAYERAL